MRTNKSNDLAEFLDKEDPRVQQLLKHLVLLEDCIINVIAAEEIEIDSGARIYTNSEMYRTALGLPKRNYSLPPLEPPCRYDPDLKDWLINPKFKGMLPL